MAYDAEAIKQAILAYYGSNSTIWSKIDLGTATSQEISFAFSQIPQRQLSIDRSASGLTLGYGYADPIYMEKYKNPILDSYDSNIVTGQYSNQNAIQPRINASFGYDDVTGQYYVESGAKAAGSALSTIVDRCSLAVTGINVGAKLGRFIDETIYNSDPDFWDDHYPNINPQTWTSISGSEGGKSFIRTIFGIENTSTAYVSEDVLAYTYQLLRDSGLLDDNPDVSPVDIPSTGEYSPPWVTGTVSELCQSVFGMPLSDIYADYSDLSATVGVFNNNTTIFTSHSGSGLVLPETVTITEELTDGIFEVSNMPTAWLTMFRPDYISGTVKPIGSGDCPNRICNRTQGDGYFITVGEIIPSPSKPISQSTQYPPTNITGTTPEQVKQQLKQNYPDLFDNSITESVLQPDGNIIDIEYVPVPWATEDTNPEEKTQTQSKPVTRTDISPSDQTDPKIDNDTMPKIVDPVVPPPTQPTTDTGTGDTPTITPVTGSASSLWAVYNPTQQQVDDFGAWLWTSDLVEQIKKLFVDPMQAIIGIHKVFVTPDTGSSIPIKCGYITSTVSAKKVTNQYQTVDCGTIHLYEYFGNVYDYEPFTTIKCYLPFIGIVPLNVSNIMRSQINIKYHVDVITGACLAEINITRDGHKNVIYTYSGSAIVSYPISSGSYAGVISSVIQTAMGVAMGSPVAVASGILSAHADTSISGSFSGSAGAMGGKIPYLIISRPQTRMAENVNMFAGLGANYTTTIEYCKGYFKVKDVHLHIEGAYDNELSEIEAILKTGVLSDSEFDGYYYEPVISDIEGIIIHENGYFEADGNIRGYNPITVQVNPVLGEKIIDSNGEYLAVDDNVQGFSKVTVAVPSGGIQLLTQSQWDALSPAQKQSYGLVAIQQYQSGFNRGILVYGADYDTYLPYSNSNNVKCKAYWDNFDPTQLTWGDGSDPVTLSALVSQYQSENAVYLDARNSKTFSIDLGSTSSDFTVYMVMKGINYNSGDVVVAGSVYYWGSSRCIMFFHRSGTVWYSSIWGSDAQFIDTQGDYVAVAIRSENMKASWFGHGVSPRLNVSYSYHDRYFTFGGYTNSYSTDLAVKFIGYVNQAEDDTTIQNNLTNLATLFNL